MRLHEYQAKRILQAYGVPVPAGEVATSVDEVYRIADRLGRRVVLKAQVLTGGRGQAGGIRLAEGAEQAGHTASGMFGMRIAGYPVSRVLVDQAIAVDQEFYVSITIDRSLAQPVIVASAQGGVEIAEVTRRTPERVYRVPIDPLLGLRRYQVRALAEDIGLARRHVGDLASIALGLYRAFVDHDATLVEVNPLVLRPDDGFCCLNSRIVVDDNALYRHRDLLEMRDDSQSIPPEQLARRYGITYVRLGGYVGCLSNGAGLAMATLDLLRSRGIRPANFVDVGKGATAEKVVRGLSLARNNSVEAVLVNVFSSLTPCDEIARGILTACAELSLDVALVVRLDGPNREEGWALLDAAPGAQQGPCIHRATSVGDAVDQTVVLVQGSQLAVAGR